MWMTPMKDENDKPYLTNVDPGDESDHPRVKNNVSEVDPEENWEDEGGAIILFD